MGGRGGGGMSIGRLQRLWHAREAGLVLSPVTGRRALAPPATPPKPADDAAGQAAPCQPLAHPSPGSSRCGRSG